MASLYDITSSSSGPTNIDESQPSFYLNVAARDPNLTLPSGQRYIRILRKSEILDLYGPPGNIYSDIYKSTLYFLAGIVPIYIYLDYTDIVAEDEIDIILFDRVGSSLGSGFISSIDSAAFLAEMHSAVLFATIDNIHLADKNSYNVNLHDHIAMFWGYIHYDQYRIMTSAEFISAIQFLVQNNLIFCGVNHATTGRAINLNENMKQILINNNVNFVNRRVLVTGSLLSGKSITGKMGHMYIKSRIKSTLKKFIGRLHDEYLWQEVTESVRDLFNKEFFRYMCGPKRVVVICDATNNIVSSRRLNVEIQYEGAYTENIDSTRTIKITIEI